MTKEIIIQELDITEIKASVKVKSIWARILPFLNIILDALIDKLIDALLDKYNITKK